MIVLTITGIFKERNSDPKAEYVRVFQKTLTIVPNAGGGLCIMNELLHINNATYTQSKRAFKTLIIPKPTPMTISSFQENQLEDATKLQMIRALSDQTNMNAEWSKKCLDETNYDYSRACFVFNELFKLNQIPQEAFSMEE
jgi:nuclear RNA export factor